MTPALRWAPVRAIIMFHDKLWGTKSQASVHIPQPFLKRKESRSGIEPRSFCLPACITPYRWAKPAQEPKNLNIFFMYVQPADQRRVTDVHLLHPWLLSDRLPSLKPAVARLLSTAYIYIIHSLRRRSKKLPRCLCQCLFCFSFFFSLFEHPPPPPSAWERVYT